MSVVSERGRCPEKIGGVEPKSKPKVKVCLDFEIKKKN
jgi:hypothetical protein